MGMIKLVGGLIVVLCLLASSASAKDAGVRYCNKKANYAVEVSGLDINPYPISKNKNTTFRIDASTGEPISAGKLLVDVSYFGFHVYSEEHDLCKETSCPVSVGKFVVAHAQELPGITPPGSYNLEMRMVDEKKQQLTCITFDFSIGLFAEDVASM